MKLIEDEKTGYYDPVPCLIPGCGQPLHLVYSSSQYLYAAFTENDLKELRPKEMESWEVRCEAGHVILLPLDDGQEAHLFGVCPSCDPEDPAEEGHDAEVCASGDFARLKEVVSMARRECPNCNGSGKVRIGSKKVVDCPFCHGTGKR